MIELLVIGGLASAGATAVQVLRDRRDSFARRELQNIEFERLMKSQEIHRTVSQARKQMVEEVRRASRGADEVLRRSGVTPTDE